MNMKDMEPDKAAGQPVLKRISGLRHGLLRLHKALIEAERTLYEQAHGRVSSGELLQLVINHEQFAWLHSISELIVRLDEAMTADGPMTEDDAELLIVQMRTLLKPSETGSDFGRRYHAALQREPMAVLAHAEVTRLLQSKLARGPQT